MSDIRDGNVSFREFDRAISSVHHEISELKENLKDEIDKTEKFLIDNISMMRVATLKEIENVERRTADKFELLQTTIRATADQLRLSNDKIVSAMEVRLTGMNEFRAENLADRNKYATKDDMTLRFESFRKEFELSMESVRKELKPLQTRSSEATGEYQQSQETWTKTGIIIVALGTAASIIISLVALYLK